MTSKETPEEYAQRRAKETGRDYAVWYSRDGQMKWVALDSRANRKVYKACGATDLKIFTP